MNALVSGYSEEFTLIELDQSLNIQNKVISPTEPGQGSVSFLVKNNDNGRIYGVHETENFLQFNAGGVSAIDVDSTSVKLSQVHISKVLSLFR